MGKSKKAPNYATTSTTTDNLFGSSTSSKNGTSYSAPNWMKNSMSTISNNLNSTMNQMLSNDFTNDANFKVYQEQLNKSAAQNYDSSVLSQLADKNLMRSSGLQAATNAFANTLADKTANLYDSYYNRQANNLSNLLNTSNTLYNYISGLNNSSQSNANSVSSYNLNKFYADQTAKQQLFNNIVNGASSFSNIANTWSPTTQIGNLFIGSGSNTSTLSNAYNNSNL